MSEVICNGCGLSEPDCPCCCDDECPVSIVRNRLWHKQMIGKAKEESE